MSSKKSNLAIRALPAEGEVVRPPSAVGSDPREVAAYIADVSLEMRNMAKRANLAFLAYLLEMVFQEAFDLSQRGRGEG